MVVLFILIRRWITLELFLWIWIGIGAASAALPRLWLETWLIAPWAPYFAAGAAANLVQRDGWQPRFALLVGCAASLSVYQSVSQFDFIQHIFDLSGNRFVCAAVILVLFGFMFGSIVKRNVARQSSPQAWVLLGALSYPIYLLHAGIGGVAMVDTVESLAFLNSVPGSPSALLMGDTRAYREKGVSVLLGEATLRRGLDVATLAIAHVIIERDQSPRACSSPYRKYCVTIAHGVLPVCRHFRTRNRPLLTSACFNTATICSAAKRFRFRPQSPVTTTEQDARAGRASVGPLAHPARLVLCRPAGCVLGAHPRRHLFQPDWRHRALALPPGA